MERRTFIGLACAGLPLSQLALSATAVADPLFVPAGEDREGRHKTLGISTIDFKVTSADSGGAILVIENTNRARGGPPKHRHLAQDELFSIIEGEYTIIVGDRRFVMRAGDSLLAPRLVPHVWAYTGNAVGRMLITFTPPGQMEPFFRAVSGTNAMPAQDPALWRAHGMEVLGPPLPV